MDKAPGSIPEESRTDGGETESRTDGGETESGTDGGETESGTDGGETESGTDGGETESGTDGGETESRAHLDVGAALQQQPVLRVEQEHAEGAVQRTRAVHPLVAAPFGGGAHLLVVLVHEQTHLVQ